MKAFLQNILPFNNREDMPAILYAIKKILAWLLCFFGAGIIGEIVIIGALTAMGKDPLHGDMFSPNTMTLIMYYGYIMIERSHKLIYLVICCLTDNGAGCYRRNRHQQNQKDQNVSPSVPKQILH